MGLEPTNRIRKFRPKIFFKIRKSQFIIEEPMIGYLSSFEEPVETNGSKRSVEKPDLPKKTYRKLDLTKSLNLASLIFDLRIFSRSTSSQLPRCLPSTAWISKALGINFYNERF